MMPGASRAANERPVAAAPKAHRRRRGWQDLREEVRREFRRFGRVDASNCMAGGRPITLCEDLSVSADADIADSEET
ncbi:MAG TPA: hypothetical protein VNO21_12640 [Polyangiaceae bacterium]|nr:hypothetical protein [Polyangiaceae bacterium]